jgi:hypothetical protein
VAAGHEIIIGFKKNAGLIFEFADVILFGGTLSATRLSVAELICAGE